MIDGKFGDNGELIFELELLDLAGDRFISVGDRVAPGHGGCYILHLNRESVDAVPLQGLTVYGAIACIGHNLAWGDRMYGKNVSGRGTASAN